MKRAMVIVRWYLLTSLLLIGLGFAAWPPPVPAPPHTQVWYDSSQEESLAHQLELAQAKDAVRGWYERTEK